MARIYLSLSVVTALLMLAALGLGLRIGDLQSASQELLKRRAESRRTEQDPKSTTEQRVAAREKLTQTSYNFRPYRMRQSTHMLAGLVAVLAAVLVNSLTVTYFIGTNRWCKEVCETYRLDRELVLRSNRLKSRAFPWSLIGILTVLGVAALGAASDPSAALQIGSSMPTWHYLAAVAGTAASVYCFHQQYRCIRGNFELIEQIMSAVAERRADRGLA